MKVVGFIYPEVRRLVNFIQRRHGDCECLYGKKSWYGKQISCQTLHCSYGAIGYAIEYDGIGIQVDNELNTILIDEGSWVDAFDAHFDTPRTIEEYEDAVEQFCGEAPLLVDEKIDDGDDGGGDDRYVMMRAYRVKDVYCRVYFGNITREIGYDEYCKD